jgi:hypothetical protein
MTEQYLQQAINQEGNFRRVDQTDVDTTLAVPAVVLGAGDQFVILSDDGTGIAYQVNLPAASGSSGLQYVLKQDASVVAVTIAAAEIGDPAANSDTFDGGASPLGISAALNTAIVQGDPPTVAAGVATPSTNWSIISPVGAPA